MQQQPNSIFFNFYERKKIGSKFKKSIKYLIHQCTRKSYTYTFFCDLVLEVELITNVIHNIKITGAKNEKYFSSNKNHKIKINQLNNVFLGRIKNIL